MKTKAYIITLLSLVLLSSCDKWISESKSSQFTDENAYQNKDMVMASLYGIYAQLQSGQLYGGNNLRTLADQTTDVLRGATGMGIWIEYTFTPTHSIFLNWWNGNWKLVAAANDFINNVDRCPDWEISADQKRALKAEAKFLRALGYFNLVLSFGRVPMVLDNPHDVSEVRYPFRAPLDQLYALMVSDLTEGVNTLPLYYGGTQGQIGRALRGSAAGLLAKVYLTRAYSEVAEGTDFQNAADLCDDIIEGNYGPYGLLPDYGQVFSPDNEGNKELLFVVKFDFLPNTPSRVILNYSHSNLYAAQTTGAAFSPLTLVQSYDGNALKSNGGSAASNIHNKELSNDQRFNYGFIMFRPTNPSMTISGHWYFQKYQDNLKTDSGDDRCDYPILRFSDILLMESEALHSGNIPLSKYGHDKYYGLNQVRARAIIDPAFPNTKLAPVADGTYNGGTYGGDYIKVILQERAWEFNCESQRRWDLVRTGKLQEYIVNYTSVESFGANSKVITPEIPLHNLFPMPQSEIDTNPNLVPPGETNNGYKSYSGDDNETNN